MHPVSALYLASGDSLSSIIQPQGCHTLHHNSSLQGLPTLCLLCCPHTSSQLKPTRTAYSLLTSLSSHFITTQAYKDCLLSAYFAVLICYMRDTRPEVRCHLDLTGSDCCTIVFSINGQWIGNHKRRSGVCHRIHYDVFL